MLSATLLLRAHTDPTDLTDFARLALNLTEDSPLLLKKKTPILSILTRFTPIKINKKLVLMDF